MAPTKQRRRGHDRGRVLVDLAVMLADGGETISDLAVLRNQPALFGEVASTPTAWRTLDAVDDACLARLAARSSGGAGAGVGCGSGSRVLCDRLSTARWSSAHSDKQGAAPTYKSGFGFHPLLAYLDATGEALAALLRPGNAGSGTAVDHVDRARRTRLAQLPVDPAKVEVIARADSAGLSPRFRRRLPGQRHVRFAIGHRPDRTSESPVWPFPSGGGVPAITADGTDEREDAEVAEITDLVDLSGWPDGTRVIARREEPHPGAQLTFTDVDGHRFQVFVTDCADADIAYLEALYRGRGRAEQRICDAKDTGLTNLPSASFAINARLAHLRAHRPRPARLDPAPLPRRRPRPSRTETAPLLPPPRRRASRPQRTTHPLRIADDWPWADHLARAFHRLRTLPLPT